MRLNGSPYVEGGNDAETCREMCVELEAFRDFSTANLQAVLRPEYSCQTIRWATTVRIINFFLVLLVFAIHVAFNSLVGLSQVSVGVSSNL